MSTTQEALAELGYTLKSDPNNHDIIVYSMLETVYDPEETFIEHIIQIDKMGLNFFTNIFKEVHRESTTKNTKRIGTRIFLPIHYTNLPKEYEDKWKKLPLKLVPLLAKVIQESGIMED